MLDREKPTWTYSPEELALIKSQVINILRANPWLSRFYQAYFKLCRSNPSVLNILGDRSVFFSDLDLSAPNPKAKKPKGPNPMSLNPRIRLCTHIKVNGVPCYSPALRGEVFCYFHQRMIRGVATPPKSRLHPIAIIENSEGIQASLMEVINALARNTIDTRRAQLILRALHIAVKNAPRVRFDLFEDRMVRETPDFPQAPAPPNKFDTALAQAKALTGIKRREREEELDCERLDATFATMQVDPTQGKPASQRQATPPASALSLVAAWDENPRRNVKTKKRPDYQVKDASAALPQNCQTT
jgi:hypothetical protein